MKTVYPTKISPLLMSIVTIFLIVGPVFLCLRSGEWHPLYICLPLFLLFLALFTSIKYEITDTQLIVRQAWIFKEVIDINRIKSIETTHTILSAPAASFDRLRISYNKYDEVIISPKRQKEFIQQLKDINPQISVTPKG